MPEPCPFCELPPARIVWADGEVIAIRDAFPVSPGHTLILPRRHVPDYFAATEAERAACWAAVARVREVLCEQLDPAPDGFNVGFNAGAAAGQTVMHLHIHLIPRYTGDVPDPRGGVRGVIPGRQSYTP